MRGERERVADRVRQLLGVPQPDPDPVRRWRWDPGRRGAVAMGALLVVVLAVLLWWMTASRPQAVPVNALDAPSAGPAASVAAASGSGPASDASPPTSAGGGSVAPSAAALVVDVAGKVLHPGIYRLPAGSRVFDAVQAAGGARAGVDLVSINLAAPLQDGQQVVVGMPGAAPTQPGAPAGASGGGSATPSVVDLNTATLDQLETLPGVGPVLGQHILDWRNAHGSFASIDQLNEVSGIGEVRFAQLKPLVAL